MSLRYLITISGIFGENKELDILPPPPPFPEIEEEDKKAEESRILREIQQKQKENELKLNKKKEEQERKRKDIERKAEEKRKLAEKRRKEKLKEKGKSVKKKKTFDFFHGLGLVKTEKEKKDFDRQKLEYKKQKELSKKKVEQERKRKDLEKQKGIELKKREEWKRKKEKQKLELEKEIQKKKPFSGILSRKGVDLELERELKEIEEIAPKPVKDIKETKLEIPEFEKIEKPMDMEKAEDEIQKAIQGMKMKKRPSIISGLFKKKEKAEDAWKSEISGTNFVGKIETPEVMPRTYDKIDYVELIEEKIHKARLFLMDFRFDEAKEVYIEIMRMYTELEPKKKSKVYQDIKELYYERKSAEKFAK